MPCSVVTVPVSAVASSPVVMSGLTMRSMSGFVVLSRYVLS